MPLTGEGRTDACLVIRVRREHATTRDESTRTDTGRATCDECGGRVVSTGHERACERCGLIAETEQIDHGPEWRSFDDNGDRQRTGAPLTPARHDRGLSTKISDDDRDANGNCLSDRKRRQLGRLRREHGRSLRSTTSDRNLAMGMMEIRRLTAALGLGNTLRDQAARLFRRAQSDGLLTGRSVEAIAAGAVYGTCRCHERPETLADLNRLTQIDRCRVKNGYQVLNRELGLPAPPREPDAFLPAICSELGLDASVERRARQLIDAAPTASLTDGANPVGIAGGALLVAIAGMSGVPAIPQTELSEATGVSSKTLRARRDEFQEIESPECGK